MSRRPKEDQHPRYEKLETLDSRSTWLNRNVASMCLASLLSDLGHEMATAILPLFLNAIGASPSALGIIEGASDGAATFAKLLGGRIADRKYLRQNVASLGYLITGLATGSFAMAMTWSELLVARTVGWFGRGTRGPSRDNLLIDSVPRARVGTALGLHRTADTLGAILGPLTAMIFLQRLGFRNIFLLSLLPGVLAAAAFYFLVRERDESNVVRPLEFPGWRVALPSTFRTFLATVFVFGIGDFAHNMLVLRAAQLLGSTPRAMTIALGLYILHNAAHAALCYPIGSLGDRVDRRRLLTVAYVIAAIAAAGFAIGPHRVGALSVLFILEGAVMAAQETLDSAVATDLLPPDSRGTGFGVLNATSGIGDFVSSIVVGSLWSSFSGHAAFGYTAVLSLTAAGFMTWAI
jgi:MFS family permease